MKAILRLLLLSCTLGPTSACAQTHTRAAGTPAPQAPLAPRVLGSGFQVGDRILLKVEGDSQFSDTFTVGPGPGLTLPVIGEIPLVGVRRADVRSEEHTSELQSPCNLVCRLLLEKKKKNEELSVCGRRQNHRHAH